jgi:hypothetical protein
MRTADGSGEQREEQSPLAEALLPLGGEVRQVRGQTFIVFPPRGVRRAETLLPLSERHGPPSVGIVRESTQKVGNAGESGGPSEPLTLTVDGLLKLSLSEPVELPDCSARNPNRSASQQIPKACHPDKPADSRKAERQLLMQAFTAFECPPAEEDLLPILGSAQPSLSSLSSGQQSGTSHPKGAMGLCTPPPSLANECPSNLSGKSMAHCFPLTAALEICAFKPSQTAGKNPAERMVAGNEERV